MTGSDGHSGHQQKQRTVESEVIVILFCKFWFILVCFSLWFSHFEKSVQFRSKYTEWFVCVTYKTVFIVCFAHVCSRIVAIFTVMKANVLVMHWHFPVYGDGVLHNRAIFNAYTTNQSFVSFNITVLFSQNSIWTYPVAIHLIPIYISFTLFLWNLSLKVNFSGQFPCCSST